MATQRSWGFLEKRTRSKIHQRLHPWKYEMRTIPSNCEERDSREEFVLPFCLENGIRMIIGDNDSKLHSKGLVDVFEPNGIGLYNGSGRTVGSHENGYPPRSHDCQPVETHFANVYHEAQLTLEDAERKRNRSRSMVMWKYALDSTWENWHLQKVRTLVDKHQK